VPVDSSAGSSVAVVLSELLDELPPPQAASTRAQARSAKMANTGHFEPRAMRRVVDFIDSPPR
jgi:hypothetical protein